MKLKLILVTISILFITNFYGQISLTSENHTPKPEYQYNFLSIEFDFASFKFVGEDTTWNIQNAVLNYDTLKRNFTRDSSFNSFPGYNFNPEICPNPGPEDTSLLRTQNAILKISSAELFQAYEVKFLPYEAPIPRYIGETYMPIFKFPFQYKDSLDAGSGVLCYSPPHVYRNTWKIADSYGTLKVNDTIYTNTLRVYTYYRFYKYVSISHDFYEHVSHKYEWYNEDFQLPILSIEFSEESFLSDGNYTQTFDSIAWLYNSSYFVSPTSIDSYQNTTNTVRIFPNPSSNTIFFNSKESIETIKLSDLNGNFLLEINNNESKSIDVSTFPNGIYILYFQLEDGDFVSKKIIVKK